MLVQTHAELPLELLWRAIVLCKAQQFFCDEECEKKYKHIHNHKSNNKTNKTAKIKSTINTCFWIEDKQNYIDDKEYFHLFEMNKNMLNYQVLTGGKIMF